MEYQSSLDWALLAVGTQTPLSILLAGSGVENREFQDPDSECLGLISTAMAMADKAALAAWETIKQRISRAQCLFHVSD